LNFTGSRAPLHEALKARIFGAPARAHLCARPGSPFFRTMIVVHFSSSGSPSRPAILDSLFPILRRAMLFLTKDFKMPKRRKAVAVDPANTETLDRKQSTSASLAQFKRSSSFEVRPSQRLCPSDGVDPGPAGFDWNDLKPF
jgi:hypothetical protein